MMPPTQIEAVYRVVTPLFCAGADARKAEIRLPSFKGVLRFWWRALAWSRLKGDLKAIQVEEDTLFGSAGGGQSRVSMRLGVNPSPSVVPEGSQLTVPGRERRVVGPGARYLGYGVMETFPSRVKGTAAGQLTRACLRAPFDFTVHLRVVGLGLTADYADSMMGSLRDALIALGMMGGMGAKSRKGYGSLAIQSLHVDGRKQWPTLQSSHDLRVALQALRRDLGPTSWPEYTALYNRSRNLLVSSNQKEPMELLDLVGRELMRYRSWGHRGRVLGQRSERNFRHDHDLMKGARRSTHPQRIAFGLPHNYGRRDHDQVGPYDRSLDRRASPLFIHIHECGAMPVAVISFLPARFLRKGKSDISVGRQKVRQIPEKKLYRPIHDFLDRLLDPTKRKEQFTDVQEVTP